jgi:hypothetical protein
MEQQITTTFYWHSSERNPQYWDNMTAVRRESCHITYNVLKTNIYYTNKLPRRYTWFRGEDLEVLDKFGNSEWIYKQTDSNKQNAMYMNKRLLAFANIINVGWKAKFFSVVFLTLTMPEHNDGIRKFLKSYKQYLKRIGILVLGHAWVLELGKKGDNPHYHVVICTNRIKNLSYFRPNSWWKGRCKTEFVRKDCVRYMCKYLQKGDSLVQNWRRFGISNLSSNLKK